MFHRQQGQKSDKSNQALQKQQQPTHTIVPQVNKTHLVSLIQRAKLNPNSLNTNDVLRLQQTIGNQAATQLLARKSGQRVQAKLTIGEPGDKYEQEADRVAAKVVQQINAPVLPQTSQSESVQRQEREDDELMMKPMVQRQAQNERAVSEDFEARINQARGNGKPLPKKMREQMEGAFGADFSRVKVHSDSQSDQLNQSIQARAFTTGQDIFFRQGEYNPESRGGHELIAHELTHVVQQGGKAIQKNQSIRRQEAKERQVRQLKPTQARKAWLRYQKINSVKVAEKYQTDHVLKQVTQKEVLIASHKRFEQDDLANARRYNAMTWTEATEENIENKAKNANENSRRANVYKNEQQLTTQLQNIKSRTVTPIPMTYQEYNQVPKNARGKSNDSGKKKTKGKLNDSVYPVMEYENRNGGKVYVNFQIAKEVYRDNIYGVGKWEPKSGEVQIYHYEARLPEEEQEQMLLRYSNWFLDSSGQPSFPKI